MWLSLVERYVRDVEVAGSNPVTPTGMREEEFRRRSGALFLFMAIASLRSARESSISRRGLRKVSTRRCNVQAPSQSKREIVSGAGDFVRR